MATIQSIQSLIQRHGNARRENLKHTITYYNNDSARRSNIAYCIDGVVEPLTRAFCYIQRAPFFMRKGLTGSTVRPFGS